MELNRGNIIKYNNTLYTVVAVVFKTAYLQKSNSTKEQYDYTLEEIKDILKIGRNSSYNLLNENYFKIIKLGKIVRISKKSFDNWLNK